MPKRKPLTALTAQGQEGLNELPLMSPASLHDEVKQALLAIIRDDAANAAAKASAARTLLEYFDDSKSHVSNASRGSEMSAAELDAAIASIES